VDKTGASSMQTVSVAIITVFIASICITKEFPRAGGIAQVVKQA
jgi:hypothetical protein